MTRSENALAMDAVNRELENAIAAGSAPRLSAIYSNDGQLLPTNHPIVSGGSDILAYWETALTSGMAAANLETVELDELGETAIEVGLYTIKGPEGTVVDEGKYLVVWKQEGGAWKYHRDIWNSSIPTE